MFVTNILCAILLLIILRIYLQFKNVYRFWQNRGLKVIEPTIFPFGNLWHFIKADKGVGHVLADWYKAVDAEVVGLYAINEPILLIKDPDIIRDVLVKDFNIFTDRGVFMDKNDSLTGQLWKLPGHKWKPLRNKMSGCFTIGKLKMMFANLLKAGTEMEIFLEKASREETIDIDDLCKRFSADIVGQSIFGLEVKSFEDPNNDFLRVTKHLWSGFNRKNMIKTALQIVAPNFFDLFNFIKFETVNKVAISFIYKVVEKITEFRERTGTIGKDMMQLLIQFKKFGKIDGETDNNISSDGDIRLTMDEMVALAYTYFFTGTETASSTLLLLLHECSINEDIQLKLQKDIDEALSKTGGEITYEAILDMKYLNMVISETLRIYPILQFLVRKPVEDYKFKKIDLEIKKGTRVYISIHGLHRDHKYYSDPEIFDPERFSKENLAAQHPMTYLPFGEGPRNCIGKRLGYFMVAVGAIHIFRKFRLSASQHFDKPLKLHPYSYTMKPEKSLLLKVSQRCT